MKARLSREEGQASFLLALLLVPLCLIAALAVDGGYGMVQLRRAQNAADFASSAAVYALEGVCSGQGTESNAAVSQVIADVVAENAPQGAGHWQAWYLDAAGRRLLSAPPLPDPTGNAPSGACGVAVQVSPAWPTFFLSLIGLPRLSAQAQAAAVYGSTPAGSPVGGPGSVQGIPPVATAGYTPSPSTPVTGSGTPSSGSGTAPGGSGGTAGPGSGGSPGAGGGPGSSGGTGSGGTGSPASGSGSGGTTGTPSGGAGGTDYGTGSGGAPGELPEGQDTPSLGQGVGIVALAPTGIHTIFGGGAGQFIVNGSIMDNSQGHPAGSTGYADTVDNFQSSSTVIYGQLDSVAQYPLDPCFAPAGPTEATCTAHTSGVIRYSGGIVGGLAPMPDPLAYVPTPTPADAACPSQASPLVDPAPVGDVYLPGVYDYHVTITGNAVLSDCGGSPGVYIFAQGVSLCPGAGDQVVGQDVMLFSEASNAGGAGGPSPGPASCGGGGPAQGTDSIDLGGAGQITLSGPASGPFAHLVLYQDRSAPANIGLDDHPQDSATITITGAIYDNSSGSGPKPQEGVLQSGQTGSQGGLGGGSITVDGIVVVDQFATAGSANLTITYDPTQVPDAGPVLVQ